MICCSVRSSSKSLTTFRRLSLVITLGLVDQSMNNLYAFWMSSGRSFCDIFTIMISRNSWKSILVSSYLTFSLPLPKSLMSLLISSLLGSKPNALKTTLRFLASMVPLPVMSKKSKAFLISFFCDSVRTCWLLRIFLRLAAFIVLVLVLFMLPISKIVRSFTIKPQLESGQGC